MMGINEAVLPRAVAPRPEEATFHTKECEMPTLSQHLLCEASGLTSTPASPFYHV
jgi:hypothetical protein